MKLKPFLSDFCSNDLKLRSSVSVRRNSAKRFATVRVWQKDGVGERIFARLIGRPEFFASGQRDLNLGGG